jgi:predicted enzyme related to lactoylglutathione lyase
MLRIIAAALIAGAALQNAASAQPLSANPVVHVEVLGANAPRLQKFYGDLFGWSVTLNPVGYGYVPVEPKAPIKLTGGIGPSPQRQPLVIFYVKVADPDATLKQAEQLGGRVVVPATDVPGGITFARFADPEGNVVGLVRRPD